MKPFPIVIHFDVLEDMLFGDDTGYESFTMNGLDLEAVIPAFHSGVIVAVAFITPAANQLMLFEQGLISCRTILAAPIRMNDDFFWTFSAP